MRIAIIGAGISGLTLAHALSADASITLFEKSRGVSGRMSTRYADPFYFDHGTQFFTARTRAFQKFLEPHMQSGLIAEWQGKVIHFEKDKKVTKRLWFEPHLVACPNMNSLCKKLAENLDIKLDTEVAPLFEKQADGWHLVGKDGAALGVYGMVISTAPPAQTIRLFEGHLPQDTPLHQANMQGCYALMLGFKRAWKHAWIAAKVRDQPIEWIAINSTKSGRNQDVTCMVVHSTHRWAEEHMDDDMTQAQNLLLESLQQATGIDGAEADYISTHRWKYAIADTTEKSAPYFDPAKNLASVGDWSSASRIEECWSGAMRLAHEIKRHTAG